MTTIVTTTARLITTLTILCHTPALDQVRLKFKNLRIYFMNVHRKIRDAPSGSAAGTPGSKWPLYDCASYLLDSRESKVSTQSSFVLPSTENEYLHLL
ncbi:hypothetical protein Pcinc_006084 [Petrolisthes cinctipes]|uniref:Uncharacterized protein n=1 Tax=Petrolisthes cinctipes TaxID=88211 RepID=A0AAE1GDI8_PETCI|nr:hypothetical protein Pcinc_006084 [Petrolisthes cinctipes]